MRVRISALIALVLFGSASMASARSFRVSQIPNGNNYTCDSCHGKRSLAVADLTPFGNDVNNRLSGDNVDWSELWNLDSDDDGFSNGLELGDPNGNWRRGDSNPDAPTSNPGVPNGGICGNADAEEGEDCDLSDMRDETCQSLGFGEGTLTCHPLCRWDARECGFCGDGYRNPDFEDCDGDAFPPDFSCTEFGFMRGELSCDSKCEIDLSTCTDEAPAVCGDGIISTGEFCDGENMGTVDCQRIAYAGGTLRCTDECKWDARDCLLPDGRRVGDEERAAEDDGSLPDDPDNPDDPKDRTGPDAGTTSPGADTGGSVSANGKSCSTAPGGASDATLLLLVALILLRRRSFHRH